MGAVLPVAATPSGFPSCPHPGRSIHFTSSKSLLPQLLVAVTFALFPLAPKAGDFGVSPVRLDLDLKSRSGILTVSNDGNTPLGFQIRLQEWTQDADGQDVYADTKDLIYFPQQLQVSPQEKRVIRIGYRNPALQQEKAYRIFVEELPEPRKQTEKSTAVSIVLRFGVPIFLRPGSVEQRGEIAQLTVAGGSIRSLVQNTGPVHFRINSVRFLGVAEGGQISFEQTLDGWYLLAGSSRAYGTPFPVESCKKTKTLRVEMVSEKLNLKSELQITPAFCT